MRPTDSTGKLPDDGEVQGKTIKDSWNKAADDGQTELTNNLSINLSTQHLAHQVKHNFWHIINNLSRISSQNKLPEDCQWKEPS